MNAHPKNPDWFLELVSAESEPRNSPPLSFQEGSRNNTYTSIAGSLVNRGVQGEQLERTLLALNESAPSPLPAPEVVGIARSVSRYATGALTEFDDLSLSREFAKEIKGYICHTDSHGWYYYQDGLWRTVSAEAVVQEAAKLFLENVAAGLKANPDSFSDARKAATKLRTHAKVKAVLNLVQSEAGIKRTGSEFDAQPNLLNVKNGTIEISGNGYVFREHLADDLLTKMADVEYEPDARCPTFDNVLSRALGKDEGAFFLRLMGYAGSGIFDQQVFGIFYGAGANGKSTLVNEVQACLGTYAQNVETSTFMTQRFGGGIRNDLARLHGARLAVSSELGIGEHLDAPLMKKLTGGDTITARNLYKDPFEFKPTAVPLFVTNARPVIDGGDRALLRRVVLLNFPHVIPANERDPSLPRKLRAERSGIFNRLLEGLLDFIREGGLNPPRSVLEDTRAYGENSDLIGQFLRDRTHSGPEHTVAAGALLDEYRAWALHAGVKPLSGPQFKAELEKRPGLANRRTSAGILWQGLALKVAIS